MKRVLFQVVILGVAGLCVSQVTAGEKRQHDSKLQVAVNDAGQIVLTWNGKEELAEARGKDGKFKRIHKSSSPYVVSPTEEQVYYRVDSACPPGVCSGNVVGYANLQLPPGLSLIANPLYYTNNDLGFWLPSPPDGSQVYKYTANGGYEVSTFDGISSQWSNPTLQVEIGTGFFFRNTSQSTLTYTFVGEVLQGWLTNSLPEGYSTKGSLVPQSVSLMDHKIPGEIGDEIRTYANDLQGGGSYNISVCTSKDTWTPDLTLGVGQGFWIYKQNAQDWWRYFTAN